MNSNTPLFTLLLGLAIGLLVAPYITIPPATADDRLDDEPASVTCTTFIDANGNASGMCFVSGEVNFRWLNDDAQNATNGSVTLDRLPAENTTVRRGP